jgi:glycerophosphoryl diester phosphodiesterase
VRLTRDGQVVVFHDRALKRLTGAAGRVDECDVSDVRALRLLGTEERVPLLGEVLELVGGRVPLLVEVKSSPQWPGLEPAVLEALRGYRGDVAIQSFKSRALRELGRNEPAYAVGHLWRWRSGPRSSVPVAFVGAPVDQLPSRAVRRRRAAGAIVLAWTVRSPAQAERALHFVDNYIFEDFVPVLDAGHGVSGPRSAADASP